MTDRPTKSDWEKLAEKESRGKDLSRETVAAFGTGAEHVATVVELASLVQHAVTAGVTVLVKGSRSMRMERVVAALTGQASRGAH